jgi:GTP-binding protein HflX
MSWLSTITYFDVYKNMNKKQLHKTKREIERAVIVGIGLENRKQLLSIDDSLNELELLAKTAGIDVVSRESQNLTSPNPATFIGSGKVKEIRAVAESFKAGLVIFDEELSPRNYRELEEKFGNNIRAIDRTTLILDIFAQHASTREGKLQVELAQYEYLYPRLTRAWSHLARQAGGGGSRAGSVGGVGLRGPGETQLEVDRRRIRDRISRLKIDIEKVREHRQRYRDHRKRSRLPVVALVGYTNAGKSTLLNALTQSNVYVADQLFATLDPTTRRLELPGGNIVLLSDTVGFIQKLPTHLIAAFRATLEEISEADLLLHVVDISHENANLQRYSVLNTLQEINAGDIPILTVLNKCDKVDNDVSVIDSHTEFEEAVPISALKKTGFSDLLFKLQESLFERFETLEVRIPYKFGQLISVFHESGKIDQIEHVVGSVSIKGKVPLRLVADYEKFRVT